MNKKLYTSFTLCLALLIPACLSAQDYSKVDLGFGMGMDYGGLGMRVTGYPSKAIAVFGGLGYAFAGVGFNGGVNANFKQKGRVRGYATAMYGYNGALVVTGDIQMKKFYYGPSFGLGLKLESRRNDMNFWNFELLLPVRDPAFEDTVKDLQNNGVSMSPVLPIAWSIGYHFGF